MASVNLSMDTVAGELQKRPATARPALMVSRPTSRHDRRVLVPRGGSASPRLHVPQAPQSTPKPAAPRARREAAAAAEVPAGELPGQTELAELVAELRQAPMTSEIPPRWRVFEAKAPRPSPMPDGVPPPPPSRQLAVGEESVALGQPSQLLFPGEHAGTPEQA